MLKKRIIPLLLMKQGRLVKGVQFQQYRDVGDAVQSAAVYNSQTADELIVLNVNPGQAGFDELIHILDELTKTCFMPLSLGGGIRTFEQAVQLFTLGADKIVLNSICYDDPELIKRLANHYGSQAIICNIDVKMIKNSKDYQLYSDLGKVKQQISLLAHIDNMVSAGVGEFMLQSIDRDGCMAGFDLSLAQQVIDKVMQPVLIAGGSGNYQHLYQAFTQTNVSGVVCGSLFNFTDSNPVRARSYLLNYDLPFKLV